MKRCRTSVENIDRANIAWYYLNVIDIFYVIERFHSEFSSNERKAYHISCSNMPPRREFTDKFLIFVLVIRNSRCAALKRSTVKIQPIPVVLISVGEEDGEGRRERIANEPHNEAVAAARETVTAFQAIKAAVLNRETSDFSLRHSQLSFA